MPLTPRFTLRQTSTHVHVEISVPSFRLSAGADGGMEVLLMGENNSEFHFYAKPYLLKLNFFPNGFVDQDEDCKGLESGVGTAKYDPAEQTVTVPLLKQKLRSQDDSEQENDDSDNHWPDLELTARMIQPKEIPKKWLHAVIDESNGEGRASEKVLDDDQEEQEAAALDNQSDNPLNRNNVGDGYGFANIFRNIFTDYCRSGLSEEMLQLKLDPENSSIDERRDERLDHESKNFDFERYLADLELSENSTDDYLYPMVMAYEPWWKKRQGNQRSTSASSTSLVQEMDSLTIDGPQKTTDSSISIFSDDEKLLLSTIPYPLIPSTFLDNSNPKQTHQLWCGILGLVLAYVYDHLATMGDSTVESAWTVFVLYPSLSWLDSTPSKSVEKTIKAFLRRVLVYPYWRNVESLGRKVLTESLKLMQRQGIHGITKALLQIHAILDKSEVHYLGNKLFVDPYLYWIQNLKEQTKEGCGLSRIISELSAIIEDDKNFRSLVNDVESSLEIDVMMEEFFGDDDESSDSCSSSEKDSDSSSSASASDDEEEDDKNIDQGDSEKHSKIELLDDQIGGNTDSDESKRTPKPSMLYVVDDNESRPPTANPLITEVDPPKNGKKITLIEEI